jgi:hypothetical protein
VEPEEQDGFLLGGHGRYLGCRRRKTGPLRRDVMFLRKIPARKFAVENMGD